MDRTVISWTPENWLTILLMVALGFGAIGLIARTVYAAQNKGQ